MHALSDTGNEEVKLTATEYNLLALFARNAGKVLTHSFICREIWGNPYADNAQVLRVHIAQLRKKIEVTLLFPELLITEPAVGYRLNLLLQRSHDLQQFRQIHPDPFQVVDLRNAVLGPASALINCIQQLFILVFAVFAGNLHLLFGGLACRVEA